MNSLKRFAGNILGDRFLGTIDYFRFPERRESWGGPFNGQAKRKECVEAILRCCRPRAIVETGTFRGTTTAYLAKDGATPVFTVEGNERFYGFARTRLRALRNVVAEYGDSRVFLKRLAGDGKLAHGVVFFYLDAHWEEDLPLAEELEIIFSDASSPIVMVDDFEVPGDSGYKFDDYGPGKALNSEYAAPLLDRFGLTQFYPAAPSFVETGARRGFTVLANNPSIADLLAQSGCLEQKS